MKEVEQYGVLACKKQTKRSGHRVKGTAWKQGFFFITTFKRYQVQINILTELERTIREEGTLVTKEYVKGRGNVYTHPAIAEYNRTSTASNQTVQTLMKIITTLRKEDEDGGSDLLSFLRKGKWGNDDE